MRLLMVLALLLVAAFARPALAEAAPRPNFLFAIADDWGWPHAGAYGDPVVQTPSFDRLAREGLLLNHAYVSAPSCTPSRNAILTGQWHWRLGAGANLWSEFPARFTTYPELLKQAGYHVGFMGKAYGPGSLDPPRREVAGRRYKDFTAFLRQRDAGQGDDQQPFCFWLGGHDPHRPYKAGSGVESGMDLAKIKLPAAFPDNDTVRSDVADYYWEVQRFDRMVGDAIAQLKRRGLWENTVVVMTGDHGMPFPRGKANLYDLGTRVPLAVSWPAGGLKPGSENEDFVNLIDLAPTFLELAGVPVPDDVTGRSFAPLLTGAGEYEAADYTLFGKERHTPIQEAPDRGGYPSRGIRTHDYLYIRNFSPNRWPNGTPNFQLAFNPGAWYSDCDNGPTKFNIIEHQDASDEHRRAYELAFAKRPAEELYDLRSDPDQLNNVAGELRYAVVKAELAERLWGELVATGDPRVAGRGAELEQHHYQGGGVKHPDWKAIEKAARESRGSEISAAGP